MNEIARVMKIEGKRITLKGAEPNACFGCMNQECRQNDSRFEALNRQSLPLEEYQLVEVVMSSSSLTAQALIAFGIPAFAFVLTYMALAWIAPSWTEAARSASALAVLAVAGVCLYWIRKYIPTKSLPEIVRIISEAEAQAPSGGGEADPGEAVNQP